MDAVKAFVKGVGRFYHWFGRTLLDPSVDPVDRAHAREAKSALGHGGYSGPSSDAGV